MSEKIELKNYKDIIAEKLSKWREDLVQRTYMCKEAELRHTENPRSVINTNNGKMSIKSILKSRHDAMLEAISNVQILEELYKGLETDEQFVLNEALKLKENRPTLTADEIL